MKYLSKKEVIDAFNEGKIVKTCSGLWNNPQTKGIIAKTLQDIESMYQHYALTERKLYDNDDTIYVHGYTSCDMF